MELPKEKLQQIERFLQSFTDFLQPRTEFVYYKGKSKYAPGSGVIELASGIVLPESEESVFVLHNEIKPFLLEVLLRFFSKLNEEAGNNLFGFAERPILEYINLWIFLYVHPVVSKEHKFRLRALLLAGHYKYFSDDRSEYDQYMTRAKGDLKPRDLQYLGEEHSASDYFKRLWQICESLRNTYDLEHYQGFLENSHDFKAVYSHQNMRVHSNPWSLNELLGEFEKTNRHKLLLCLYARQVIDYFIAAGEPCKDLVSQFEKIFNGLTTGE